MSVATLNYPSASTVSSNSPFHRSLSALLVTSRLIGQSLTSLRTQILSSPEIDRKINDMIATGQQGETELRKPLRDAGIVLPTTAKGAVAGPLVTTLYQGVPTEGAPAYRSAETVVNLRLLAQHLELRARLAAEQAKQAGEEPLSRVLLNWARQWWRVARP